MDKHEDALQRNKEIAVMLGCIDADGDLIVPKHLAIGCDYGEWADTKEVNYDNLFPGCTMTHYINVSQECFSTDWRWLMAAVEFVEAIMDGIAYKVCIDGYKCEISTHTQYALAYDKHVDIYALEDTKHAAVFLAVSTFAKLYNANEL